MLGVLLWRLLSLSGHRNSPATVGEGRPRRTGVAVAGKAADGLC